MSEEIKVSVVSWGAGRSLMLSWSDPITGKRKTRSAKTKDWRTAERLAGELEAELRAGPMPVCNNRATYPPLKVSADERGNRRKTLPENTFRSGQGRD